MGEPSYVCPVPTETYNNVKENRYYIEKICLAVIVVAAIILWFM